MEIENEGGCQTYFAKRPQRHITNIHVLLGQEDVVYDE